MASPRAGNSLTLTVRRGTVLNQVLKQPSGRQTPLLARQRGGGGAGDWDTVLQSDRAGAADNAEDFTREFMSQLMGNTGANTANTQNMTDNVTAPAQHSNGYQQQAVTMSTPTKQVRRGEIF